MSKSNPKVSIIIRTRNEERWITPCLSAVFEQDLRDFEVILVDNESTDRTLDKARLFDVNVVSVGEFRPGFAINEGVRASRGEFIVCLSAHCIPVGKGWLGALLANFDDERVAGVYGRQEPMSFSSDFDKRDLLITFGLDKRVQIRDSFFHNANSMFRRDVWDEVPFDEDVTNIEDRLWAEEILRRDHRIIYEPEASVYHYHGIHQDRDPRRCSNIVRILEKHQVNNFDSVKNVVNKNHLNIAAVIPVRGESPVLGGRPLLERTIGHALASRLVRQVIVSTDDNRTAALARDLGADVPFIRDPWYSRPEADLEQVMRHSLEQMESRGIFPDVIVLMEITFPFREEGLIDRLIYHLVDKGLDSVLPAKAEYNSCWIETEGSYQRVDTGFTPREYKKPVYTGIKGLGCATHPAYIREGKLFGPNMGIVKIDYPPSFIEVRGPEDFRLAEMIASLDGKNALKAPDSHHTARK